MIERSAGLTEAIDQFLASSLAATINEAPAPPWPDAPDDVPLQIWQDTVSGRIAFHGIALALLRHPGKLADWPADVRKTIGDWARGQSFWEIGHRETLCRLLEALRTTDAAGLLTKGTALAYSVYPDPAVRRRGDSDVLLGEVSRGPVRAALRAGGFAPVGDSRPLQESWAAQCSLGFTHVFDLHWRINASAMLSERLEAAGIGTRSIALPRLAEAARAIAPADNMILVAINRASHESFSYRSGEERLFDKDRLTWALDFDMLSKSFTAQDWLELRTAAAASGAAPLVRSGLAYARDSLGSPVPHEVFQHLDAMPADPELMGYFGAMSPFDRLRADVAASPTIAGKFRVGFYTMFPGSEVLHERFPDSTHLPLMVLQLRRIGSGLGKLLWQRG